MLQLDASSKHLPRGAELAARLEGQGYLVLSSPPVLEDTGEPFAQGRAFENLKTRSGVERHRCRGLTGTCVGARGKATRGAPGRAFSIRT